MTRMTSFRYVIKADHIFPPTLAITRCRTSSRLRAGISGRSGSLQIACASSQSIPCLTLFAADFFGSNSNRIRYRNYTISMGLIRPSRAALQKRNLQLDARASAGTAPGKEGNWQSYSGKPRSGTAWRRSAISPASSTAGCNAAGSR